MTPVFFGSAANNFGVQMLLDGFFERRRSAFSWNRPKAGTIGLVRLLQEPDAQSFCDRAVEQAGGMLLPSTVYEYGRSHFRLGFCRENMPEALNRLEDFLGNQ